LGGGGAAGAGFGVGLVPLRRRSSSELRHHTRDFLEPGDRRISCARFTTARSGCAADLGEVVLDDGAADRCGGAIGFDGSLLGGSVWGLPVCSVVGSGDPMFGELEQRRGQRHILVFVFVAGIQWPSMLFFLSSGSIL
jgi:hypothetical protein